MTAVLGCATAVCSAQGGYKINGDIDLTAGKVCVITYFDNRPDTLARAAITGGKFVLEGEVAEPVLAFVNVVDQMISLPLFLENTNFTVNINTFASSENKVAGGREHELYVDFKEIRTRFDQLQAQFVGQLMGGQIRTRAQSDSLKAAVQRTNVDAQKAEEDFLRTNPDASASAYFATDGMTLYTPEYLQKKYDLLSDKGKATIYGKQLGDFLAFKTRTAAGVSAPDFTFTTEDGRTVKISDVKGKVKVIMLWDPSSLVGISDHESLADLWRYFHNKGLQIISLSTGSDQERWKEVVGRNDHPWLVGFDWKDGHSAAVEFTRSPLVSSHDILVLDENNKILMYGLRPKELHDYVAALLN